MGYTHYWYGLRNFTAPEWQAICDDARQLFDKATVTACREYDRPQETPEIAADVIAFNGPNEDGHETFWFQREPDDFQFCKTAAKPYDLLVTAMLIVSHKHAPDALRISSDGGVEDWRAGLDFTRQVLGADYGMPFGKDSG